MGMMKGGGGIEAGIGKGTGATMGRGSIKSSIKESTSSARVRLGREWTGDEGGDEERENTTLLHPESQGDAIGGAKRCQKKRQKNDEYTKQEQWR